MSHEISSVRIRRLLRLLVYLRRKGEKGAEVPDIMTHCEYSGRRALQDDIRLLRDEYHAEISYKRSTPQRYCLTDAGDLLLSLNMNINEIGALSIGLGMAMHFIPDIKNSCKSLWKKINGVVPESMFEVTEWLVQTVTMQYPVSGIKPLVFETILEAIHEHEAIKIDYVLPYKEKQAKTYIISPYDVFFKAHSWHMAAGCEDKVLMFTLSRIQKISLLDENTFVPPPEDYNVEDFKSSAWYVKPGELKYTMRLTIYEPMASIVSETPRHLTQIITRTSPDTVELTAAVSDLEEAAKWILSCSPHIKVEAPEELRNIVRSLAEKTISVNSV